MWPCLGLPRYLVSCLKADQMVAPVFFGFLDSRQWNWQPFHSSSMGRPRGLRYQPQSLAGFLALKKTPPMPVTLCLVAMAFSVSHSVRAELVQSCSMAAHVRATSRFSAHAI